MTFKDIFVGGPRPIWLRYLLLIGVFTLLTRVIMDSQFSSTSLLYILLPYLVSVAVYFAMPEAKGSTKIARLGRHLRSALIVMLGSSAILQEGVICVVMFAPIYILVVLISYALMKPRPDDHQQSTFKVSFVPIIFVLVSLEGVTQTLSFERAGSVTRSQTLNVDIEALKLNMAMPIHLEEGRSPFLSLFPLPYEVTAGSLNAGDVHIAKFAYKRWLVTNVHYGETHVKIAEVGPNHVRTQIVYDDSYFSHYMSINGTLVEFTALDNGQTEVSLTVDYTRKLDPAWYFAPLQRRAVEESADYLIKHVIARS